MEKTMNKHEFTIPPFIPLLMTFLVFSVIFAFMIYRDVITVGRYEIADVLFLIVAVSLLLYFSVHWRVSAAGVRILFLWIPMMLIPWQRISDAQELDTWYLTKASKINQHGIVISLDNAPAFRQDTDRIDKFLLKNFLKAYVIFVSPRTANKVACFFQKHCSNFCR